jgi:hypothetical protein
MIFDRRIVLLFAAAALGIVGLLLVLRSHPATVHTGGKEATPTKETMAEATTKEGTGKPAKAAPAPQRLVKENPEQWRSIGKGTSLSLVSPKSLALSEGAILLLDLNPTEVKAVNEQLAQLVERVREVEKKNAYVRVGADGSEEIVVPPFDRGPLLKKFRETVEKDLGKNVADFCAEQMLYDLSLALGNAEVRIYIEPKNETNPADMLVISRGVHRRNTSGNPKWDGEAAPPLVTKTIAGKDFGIRYRHLFYMANKGLLPRKPEGAK